MDEAQSLFLTSLSENHEGTLTLVFKQGQLSEVPETIQVFDVEFKDARKVEVSDNSTTFKVTFDSYAAYNVLDESYDADKEVGEYTGKFVRIYSKSDYLNYVRKVSIAFDICSKLTHYMFASVDHIISVVSEVEPEIEKLAPTPAKI